MEKQTSSGSVVEVGKWADRPGMAQGCLEYDVTVHLAPPLQGVITVKGLVDREKGDFYTLTVVADDGGPKVDSTVVSGSPGESPQRVQPITGPRPPKPTSLPATQPAGRQWGRVSAAQGWRCSQPCGTFLAETSGQWERGGVLDGPLLPERGAGRAGTDNHLRLSSFSPLAASCHFCHLQKVSDLWTGLSLVGCPWPGLAWAL